MKKISFLILALFFIFGCLSIPRKSCDDQIYAITRVEKKVKYGIGAKKTVVVIRDFRRKERYDEDIDALKERIEEYIAAHPDLNDSAKNNLRALKVTSGTTKEEARLLLGEPDKAVTLGRNTYAATEAWIYRLKNLRAFTMIIPVFLVHEGYYLYFKADALVAIERRYLEQNFGTSAPDLHEKESKED